MKALPRANPLPEIDAPELIRTLLAEIEEEERLSRALGIDLTPAAPRADHALLTYAPLEIWLERSEEVRPPWRAERTSRPNERP